MKSKLSKIFFLYASLMSGALQATNHEKGLITVSEQNMYCVAEILTIHHQALNIPTNFVHGDIFYHFQSARNCIDFLIELLDNTDEKMSFPIELHSRIESRTETYDEYVRCYGTKMDEDQCLRTRQKTGLVEVISFNFWGLVFNSESSRQKIHSDPESKTQPKNTNRCGLLTCPITYTHIK